MSEMTIQVDHRESLIYLLSEAAEIEHGLMCCYLYAAWSLRRDAPGRSGAQNQAIARWRSELLAVAREEMVHLALVGNLSNAVGGSVHLTRPNFPVWEGYHPTGVVLKLAPFDVATMDHFVYMERPEGAADPDGEGFDATWIQPRPMVSGRLVPTAQDFETVGHLYRGIENGLVALEAELGTRGLFLGDPAMQLDARDLGLADVVRVVDLASARSALEVIVTQGEGLQQCDGRSHYRRFRAIQREYAAILKDDPAFAPAWPAATNPVMRAPGNPHERVHIVLEPAAPLLDLTNALYALTLRALSALMSPLAAAPDVRATLSALTGEGMRAMSPLGERLAELPANPSWPGVHAGMTFTMSRSLHLVADRRAALAGMSEACEQIATRADDLTATAPSALQELAKCLRRHRDVLDRLADAPASSPAAAPSTPRPFAAEGFCGGRRSASVGVATGDGVERASGRSIEIGFESKRCIHARHCVLGAPRVFLANTPGEWIKPDAMPAEEVAAIARACPSGAITYRRLDGGPDEAPPEVNTLRVRENGPLALHADISLTGISTGMRMTLCRCGQSQNKPYCDGAHVAAAFAASGEPATGNVDALAARGGPLEVTPTRDGPLAVRGNLELCAGTGRTILRTTTARLCRCGHSADKPFCDGSHSRVGFRAEGA